MRRGKQQILFNYLPGKTFDFAQIGLIARITSLRGIPKSDLNLDLILRAVEESAGAWSDTFRPSFRNAGNDPSRLTLDRDNFILMEPRNPQAEMFPLVLWCQRGCNRVFDQAGRGLPSRTCPACRQGRLVQLRWIKVHRCGAIEPLTPYCQQCRSSTAVALDTRGSERIAGFRWICATCRRSWALFGGPCRACTWPNRQEQNMDIEVHRAGRTYYSHHVVLLNQPGSELTTFLSSPEWPLLVAAAFCEFSEVRGRRLLDLVPQSAAGRPQTGLLSDTEIAGLRARGFSQEQIEQFRTMQAQLQAQRAEQQEALSPGGIARLVRERTSLPDAVWQRAGQELLETVMPIQSGTTTELFDSSDGGTATAEGARKTEAARRLKCRSVALITDFPITTATFAFSRVEYLPDRCRLNPFPADRDSNGRFPIFVDVIQADAIMLRLDEERVWSWLERNGIRPGAQGISTADPALMRRAYFVRLLDIANLRQTIESDQPDARMVFGLLHTLSHLTVRKAALLCGLDHTSLSEYVLPRALSWALYCNHRFGATIGALAALFEQSLAEWLGQVYSDARRCVYDPVCSDQGGSCHACVHLAETSCRFFNLNLSRAFLFGGPDRILGSINVGFLDSNI